MTGIVGKNNELLAAFALFALAPTYEAERPRRRVVEIEPRREPVTPRHQREQIKPEYRTDEDNARLQAAAERRAKRNAKHAAKEAP
jgi:hypothetical protein